MQKEKVQTLLDGLPDEIDIPAFVAKLELLHGIDDAEREIASEQCITHEQVRGRLAKWLE